MIHTCVFCSFQALCSARWHHEAAAMLMSQDGVSGADALNQFLFASKNKQAKKTSQLSTFNSEILFKMVVFQELIVTGQFPIYVGF